MLKKNQYISYKLDRPNFFWATLNICYVHLWSLIALDQISSLLCYPHIPMTAGKALYYGLWMIYLLVISEAEQHKLSDNYLWLWRALGHLVAYSIVTLYIQNITPEVICLSVNMAGKAMYHCFRIISWLMILRW